MLTKTPKCLLTVYAAILLLNATPVLADKQDTLNFAAGVSAKYDDNLFRSVKGNTRSDIINSLFVGVDFNKSYSLQQINFSAKFTRNFYKDNDQLDWNNKQYNGAWNWAFTPKLRGTVSASRSESVVNFNDVLTNVANPDPESFQQIVQSNRKESLLFDYNPFGGWHFLGGATRQRQENSQAFNQNPTFTTRSLDLGTKYVFRSGSDLTVMNHTRRGDNDDRAISGFDNEFRDNETEVTLNWLLSAKSKVKMDAGYYKREHDNLSVWDFSGFQGGLAYEWTPTGKLKVNVSLSSRLGAFQLLDDLNGIDDRYTRTTGLNVGSIYQYSPKVSFNANLAFVKRSFDGDLNPLVSTTTTVAGTQVLLSRDEDDIYSASLGMNWQPRSNTALSFNLNHQKNDSNNDLFDYEVDSAAVSGNISF